MSITTWILVLLTFVCYLIMTAESGPIASSQQQYDSEIPTYEDRNLRQRNLARPYRASQKVVGYWDQSSDESDTQPQRWRSGAVTYGMQERYQQMLEQNRRMFELGRQAELWQSRQNEQQQSKID